MTYDWRVVSLVDETKERLRLSASIGSDAAATPMALVGPPVELVFPVQVLLTELAQPAAVETLRALFRELDYYLVELGEPDPWAYAIYHCGTAANAYSKIRWSYFSGSK